MSNAHSSQVARLKALKAELEELNSPAKALGGDYDDVEALNKAKEELQREKEQCEQLRNEKDETNAELGRLRVEISASKQDATSPLSHPVQASAATRKLEAEIADCNAALKEAQKKEQQRSAEVMKRDRLYQEVVALAEDKKHLMEESQIASEQAALLLMDKQAY